MRKNKSIALFFAVLTIALFFNTKIEAQVEYKVACMGFYNLENLFDTLDTPNKNDADFLPTGSYNYTGAVYKEKLVNLSKVISELGTEMTPDGAAILGVAEIECKSVLVDLVNMPALKKRNYQIVHEESPDARGIDVALVYNPKYFKELSHQMLPVNFKEGDGVYHSRSIMHVTGVLGGTDTLHIFVNHWPSRRGGAASIPKRNHAALQCKNVVDSIMAANPKAKVLIMGDLNDDPVNPSVRDILGAKRKTKEVKSGGLYNPMWDKYKKGDGTLTWNAAWNLFDQTIVSYGFLDKKQNGFFFHKAEVYRRAYLLNKEGRFKGQPFRAYSFGNYIGGYSDHLPVYAIFLQRKFK